MENDRTDEVEVELRPFKHQVGGHTCVLEVTRSTICKPFIPREAWFYENEPDELKDFTPRYLGETFVTCDIQDDRKCLVARVSPEIAKRDAIVRLDPVLTIHNSGNPSPKKRRKRLHSHSSDTRGKLDAWSSMCIDRQIKQYGFWANNQPQKFIILENLVHEYEHPCLMDLKMGRRQFGEDSNEEKRKLLESRCACSTSATLGFRISGSQAYKAKTGTYTFHDKYFGRDLDRGGAITELEQFFHNGIELRTDVIRLILVKLERLRSILMSQTKLFFHSASLLLIFDGANPKCPSCLECSCCNVQCDHCSVMRKCEINGTEHVSNMNGTDVLNISESDSNVHSGKETSCTIGNQVLESTSSCDNGRCAAKFDVRLIDFAHVSERYIEDGDIADDTIVFGLIKLKEILSTLLKNT